MSKSELSQEQTIKSFPNQQSSRHLMDVNKSSKLSVNDEKIEMDSTKQWKCELAKGKLQMP